MPPLTLASRHMPTTWGLVLCYRTSRHSAIVPPHIPYRRGVGSRPPGGRRGGPLLPVVAWSGGCGGDCPSPARLPGRGPHACGPLCAPTAQDPQRRPNAALAYPTMVDTPSVCLSAHHVSPRRSPRHGPAMPAAACGGSDCSATIVPEPQGVVGVVCRGLGRRGPVVWGDRACGLGRRGPVVWGDRACGLERQNMT